MLAGMFGAESEGQAIVVPYTASVNCAFGLVSADIVHEYSATTVLCRCLRRAEWSTRSSSRWSAKARRQLKEEGFDGAKVQLEWSIDLRYSRQVHEVTTPVRACRRRSTTRARRSSSSDFEALYERKYGKGSAYP